MSAFVDTNDGITSPGQSQRINDSSRNSVYNQPTYTRLPVYIDQVNIDLTWSQNDNFGISPLIKFPTN